MHKAEDEAPSTAALIGGSNAHCWECRIGSTPWIVNEARRGQFFGHIRNRCAAVRSLRARARLAVLAESSPSLTSDGVDRFPPGAAIVMIDPIALIMALYEACSYEVRYGPADVAPAGTANARPHFCIDDARRGGCIGGKRMPAFKVAPYSLDNRAPTCVTLSHGYQSVTEPIANRHMTIGILDIGTGAVGCACCLRDQIENHVGVARTPRDGGEPFEQGREVHHLLVGREEIGSEHSMNLAQSSAM